MEINNGANNLHFAKFPLHYDGFLGCSLLWVLRVFGAFIV